MGDMGFSGTSMMLREVGMSVKWSGLLRKALILWFRPLGQEGVALILSWKRQNQLSLKRSNF